MSVCQPQRADSWFPDYTWRLCACPHCGQHLGWTFEVYTQGPIDAEVQADAAGKMLRFHGIILDSILGENCKSNNCNNVYFRAHRPYHPAAQEMQS